MKIVKQKDTLTVLNYDLQNELNKKPRHGALLPSTIRCLIAGPSGCGKTNVVIALIEHLNGVHFENIYIYSKSLFQPKYKYLEHMLKPIKGVGYYAYNNSANIIKPIDAKTNSVFIFDDIALEKQDVMREYFTMGRHKFIDCFYLCQTYTHMPKHLIRDNANMLIIFNQDELNLKHVYNDHVGADMTFENFKNICSLCWREKFSFLVINKECDINRGRYRKGFDHFIIM